MSEWTEIQPVRPLKSAVEIAPVRLGIRAFKDIFKGNVLLRNDIVDALELSDTPLRIMLGCGGRAHQLALVPDEQGAFSLSEVGRPYLDGGLGRTWSAFFPLPAGWPCVQISAIAVRFELENNQRLVLDLPASFWDKASQTRLLASFTPTPRPSIVNRPQA